MAASELKSKGVNGVKGVCCIPTLESSHSKSRKNFEIIL